MSFTTLTHDQQLALIALMEAIAMANGTISEGERRGIDKVATDLGDEVYRTLLDEVDSRFESVDELKAFLKEIKEKEAQELIYGTVWEESVADPDIKQNEAELVNWLQAEWQIEC